jgi:hypothetical protein
MLRTVGIVLTAACIMAESSGNRGVAQVRTIVKARRLERNPLITPQTSASLGDDINNPTVIRVPDWVEKPMGRYYMYFAHHKGHFIRLAYADAISGPWKIYEPGVLHVSDTAFYRPQPDPPDIENIYTHVASPELLIDASRRQLVLWFHGMFTDGQRWPEDETAARDWVRKNNYGQLTQVALSNDGVHFRVLPSITKASYLRVFPFGDGFYGMARLGVLLRSKNPLTAFENGPNPFGDGPYARRVRHVAIVQRGDTLYTFFTGLGDAPERLMVSTIALRGNWEDWRASEPMEVLRPEAPYECPSLPNLPSEPGEVEGPVRQLRDPGVFQEDGRTFLFYSICGEQGIAAAELSFE